MLNPRPLFKSISHSFRIRIVKNRFARLFAPYASLVVDLRVILLSVVHLYLDSDPLAGPATVGTKLVIALEATHDVGGIFFQRWDIGVEKGEIKAFVF